MTAKKGIPTILQALALLRARGLACEYTLIGDGDDRDEVLQLIFDLGLQDCCRWKGTLPHEQVVRQIERADLFALGCEIGPDGDRDGIPNVLVESLAMGLPAVGTTVSALPEIIRDGDTGLLSEPGDAEAMAANMQRLLTDESLRARVISTGTGACPVLVRQPAADRKPCRHILPRHSRPATAPPDMRIAFYAPFKPLGHPNPSGDLIIATGLYDHLKAGGHEVQVVSTLRSRWIYWKPWDMLRAVVEKNRIRQSAAPETGGPVAHLSQLLQGPGLDRPGYVSHPADPLCDLPGHLLDPGTPQMADQARVSGSTRKALLAADLVLTNRRDDLVNLQRLLPAGTTALPGPGIDPAGFTARSCRPRTHAAAVAGRRSAGHPDRGHVPGRRQDHRPDQGHRELRPAAPAGS